MTRKLSIGGEVVPLPRDKNDRVSDLGAVVPARAERGGASADVGNVVAFARPRASDAPEIMLPADLARLPQSVSSVRQAAGAAFSLALHGGLVVLFLLHQEPPLNSIGLEVMTVEIVLGATAPAGVATTPGESQTQSTSAPEEKSTEVAQTEPKATEQEQTVEVATQETASEQKTEQPRTEARPDEAKPYETAAAPEPQPAQAEPKPTVAMVESPNPEMSTSAPRETPPDATEVTLLPQPDKPVEKKPDPKPVQAAPPKPVKNAAPAKEQRRIAAPTRDKAAKEAKASTPSTQANNVGVGRSDRDTNYPGLVSAHLRRHQQYPADARSRGQTGTASVTFGVGGSGSVTSVRLAGSSGVGSIDQEVQAMVRRASPFPAPPGGRAQSFTIPVNFRLN